MLWDSESPHNLFCVYNFSTKIFGTKIFGTKIFGAKILVTGNKIKEIGKPYNTFTLYVLLYLAGISLLTF